jgi:hypothetical protein
MARMMAKSGVHPRLAHTWRRFLPLLLALTLSVPLLAGTSFAGRLPLSATPHRVNFGRVGDGGAAQITVSFTNVSGSDITLGAEGFTGGATNPPFSASDNLCVILTHLSAGSTCNMVIHFTNDGSVAPGRYSGQFQIQDGDGNVVGQAPLQATAL